MNRAIFARAEEFIWKNARLLESIIAEQQADGGWNITWVAVSPSCELEWRGWSTLATLRRLRANGRLPT